MAVYQNVNGVIREVKNIYENVNGVIRQVNARYQNVNGVIRQTYGAKKVYVDSNGNLQNGATLNQGATEGSSSGDSYAQNYTHSISGISITKWLHIFINGGGGKSHFTEFSNFYGQTLMGKTVHIDHLVIYAGGDTSTAVNMLNYLRVTSSKDLTDTVVASTSGQKIIYKYTTVGKNVYPSYGFYFTNINKIIPTTISSYAVQFVVSLLYIDTQMNVDVLINGFSIV